MAINAQQNMIKVDEISKFFILVVILSTLAFANGFYIFACLSVFCALFPLVQQPYRTGVFTLMLVMHVVQIIASVFQANYLGLDINYRSKENSTAILLSLFGLIALFAPIIYFQQKAPKLNLEGLKKSAEFLSTERCMYLYISSFFIGSLLEGVAFTIAGIAQIVISILKIKWFFFLLFGYMSMIKKEKRTQFYIFIVLEIVLGFFSFFSEFKTVIYYLIILLASFVASINFRQIIIGIFIGSALLFLALVWTSVKVEYRKFLNEGKSQQNIEVSRDEALNKLYDLGAGVSQDDLESSTKDFLDRMQYTYHFAKTIERVPTVIPYQEGNNWLEVISFTTTPRFLNPDKPKLDNSIKTSYYTGLHYAGAKKGVSFSLGYFAECYIDFGKLGMIFPLLLLGFLYGKLFNYFIRKSSDNTIFNYAIAGSFFMEFYGFEMDGTYLIGRLFASILTYFILLQFFFPAIYQAVKISQPDGRRKAVLWEHFRI